MLPIISRERQRIVKRIIVNHIETTKKTSQRFLNHANIKSHDDQSTGNKKQIARKLLEEYLHDSSVHGVKYLGNLRIKSNSLVRFFWALIMILSFVFLSCMIGKVWERYSANPTRTVVESFQSPIFQTPFPAVTLCPLVPPLISRRIKLLERWRLPPNINNNTVTFLLKYGPAFLKDNVPGGKEHLDNLKALLKFNQMKLIDFIKFLRPCEDLVETCLWEGKIQNCSDLFKISYTSAGICCSFNYHLEEYIKDNKTKEGMDLRRTASYGATTGLTVLLHRDLLVENDGTGDLIRFSTNSIGVLVYSHHPLEYVSPIFARHMLQAKQELRIGVNPFIKKKLSGYYEPNSRGELNPRCADENAVLKYFPIYRYSNCFISCSVNMSLDICGCVPYYYEPVATKYLLPICDLDDLECLSLHGNDIRIIQDTDRDNITCVCRNPCRNVYYTTEASTCVLNDQSFSPSYIYKNRVKSQAVLNVFMSFETFITSDTIPIANEIYLLASVGGIFSLFMGCSFISAVEILYYIGLYFYSRFNSKKLK